MIHTPQAHHWQHLDWQRLSRLRGLFLNGNGNEAYWESEKDLDAYDITFGARIGWKWDWMLEELVNLGWCPPVGEILDWGCGSGVASRAFLRKFGSGAVSSISLWDHSRLAMQVAAQKITQAFPEMPVREVTAAEKHYGILLASHVLTELTTRDREKLLGRAQEAEAVLWVEPGTREASNLLLSIRTALLPHFTVTAPCPVGNRPCPLIDHARHWCHYFALPPAFVFTNSHWARFGKETGIDLRSLPLSFLVLQRQSPPSLPEGTMRVLGRPRLEKGAARVLTCGPDGLNDLRLSSREHPELFRQARKGVFPSLLRLSPA